MLEIVGSCSERRDVESNAVLGGDWLVVLLLLENWSLGQRSFNLGDGVVHFLLDDLLLLWRRSLGAVDGDGQARLGRWAAALEGDVGRSVHRVASFLFGSWSVIRDERAFALSTSGLFVFL